MSRRISSSPLVIMPDSMRWKPRVDETQITFRREFSRETLRAERLRATILAGAYLLILAGLLVYQAMSPDRTISHVLLGVLPMQVIIGLLLGATVYELAIWGIFGLVFRARGRLPAFPRYLNAIIEVSFLSAAVVLIGESLGPTFILVTPLTLGYFLFIALAALRMDFLLCVFTGAVAALEYILMAIFAAGQVASMEGIDPTLLLPMHHSGKALLFLLGGLVTGFVTLQVRWRVMKSLEAVAERARLANIFGQHVAPEIVDQMLRQKTADIPSEMRYVTVMFLDIRSFSAFTEGREPEDVVTFLNRFFDIMIATVTDHNGVVFKFMGDGFMAVFGAPFSSGRNRKDAVQSAIMILGRIQTDIDVGKLPPIEVGIGVHAGEALAGNIGSATRKEYTVIGDVVNLANRIEQMNKQFGSRLLVSGEVWQAVQKDYPKADSLGPVTVKGRETPVELWKIV